MKPVEIFAAAGCFDDASPEEIISSPAWAMPVRVGDVQTVLAVDGEVQSGAIDLDVSFDGEKNVLSICDSPAFPELHRVWGARDEMPREMLLALVEMECGGLLQGLENAVRRVLKVDGVSPDGGLRAGDRRLALRAGDIRFSLFATPAVAAAFGQPRFLDISNDCIRSISLPAEIEYAVFAMDPVDIESLAPGDEVLLPELDIAQPRYVAAGRFAADSSGVEKWRDDGRVRAVAAGPAQITLGELFDASEGSRVPSAPKPVRLRLVKAGKTIAEGVADTTDAMPSLAVDACP